MLTEKKSNNLLLVTWAPTTWKNTFMEQLIVNFKKDNNIYVKRLIVDTTRPKRKWEINWIDYNFISIEDYENFFRDWRYFWDERSNLYNWNYYWTPKDRLDEKNNAIWLPTCVQVAKEIKKALDSSYRIHLHANEEIRRQRLLGRWSNNDEVLFRLNRWDSHWYIKEADININSWENTVDQILLKHKGEILTSFNKKI